ncbi:MAG TPA: hypothetical protein VGG17_11100 [Acidimicrobiales bacterium]
MIREFLLRFQELDLTPAADFRDVGMAQSVVLAFRNLCQSLWEVSLAPFGYSINVPPGIVLVQKYSWQFDVMPPMQRSDLLLRVSNANVYAAEFLGQTNPQETRHAFWACRS